jgi:MoaA/NifB/PqqE/SkfB family radical SAM enzyme
MHCPESKKVHVAFEISRRCNSRCRHCVADSGPSHRDIIPIGTAHRIIDQIALGDIFYRHVTLTGGEPLLFLNRVREVISYGKTKGVQTSIVTNGFWGRTLDDAKRVLEFVGPVRYIEISTDMFHQEFVSLDNVINCARACIEKGVNVSIRGLHFGFNDIMKKRAEDRLSKILRPLLGQKVRIVSSELSVGGRAQDIYHKLPLTICSRLPKINTCFVLENIFISSNGDVYPCCSNTLSMENRDTFIIGNVQREPLARVVNRAKGAFIPGLLKRYGVGGLVRLIGHLKGKRYIKRYYTRIQKDDGCQVCARIFEDREAVLLFGGMLGKVRSG